MGLTMSDTQLEDDEESVDEVIGVGEDEMQEEGEVIESTR